MDAVGAAIQVLLFAQSRTLRGRYTANRRGLGLAAALDWLMALGMERTAAAELAFSTDAESC